MTEPWILSAAIRLPGANTLDQYWANIIDGTEPPNRSDLEGITGKTIGAAEGQSGTAAVRRRDSLLMEVVKQLYSSSSDISPYDVLDGEVGVFVVRSHEEGSDTAQRDGDSALTYLESASFRQPNQISRALNLSGPSEVIDTGQSSAISAIHRARIAIEQGDCAAAIVAGVNINTDPTLEKKVDHWGALSPSQECFPFDERANGYVRGEGAVAILVGSPSSAAALGLPPRAIIRGSAVGHSGKSDGAIGIGTASVSSQVKTIKKALRNSGTSPKLISYIEAHGTGTPIGDVVESRALVEGYDSEGRLAPCYVGSSKGLIGHLESVSGLAAVAKVLKVISEQTIPPSAKFSKLARQVGFDGVNFIVPTSPKGFVEGETICAINSVSAGGSTGHLLLASPGPSTVTKSVAKNGETAMQLKQDAISAGRDAPRTPGVLGATNSTSAGLHSMRELVATAIATITESESSAGDAGVSFTELGLESMDLLSLAENLSETLGIDLAITDLYQFPSVEELSAHLIAISSIEPEL